MTQQEIVLEKKHAKYMRDFFKIHKNGSYKAMMNFKYWEKEYLTLKNKAK